MTLTQKLDSVMRERSLLDNARSTYHFWVKAFYRFNAGLCSCPKCAGKSWPSE